MSEAKDNNNGPAWRCNTCHVDNSIMTTTCTLCDAPRPLDDDTGNNTNNNANSNASTTAGNGDGENDLMVVVDGAGAGTGTGNNANGAAPKPAPPLPRPNMAHLRGRVDKPSCCGAFMEWANPFADDHYELRSQHLCVMVVVVVLTIICAPMLAESFEKVMFDQYGIGYSTVSGEIDNEITGAGRHFVGLVRDFHRLPKLISTIDFSSTSGNAPMMLRVKNGQQIEVDISFQFRLPESNVLPLYRDFKFNYVSNFRKTAESTFRLVSAKYHAEEFFHNRTLIEEDMLVSLRAEIEERHAELVGLQVRKIDLPDSFESRLVEIELKKQDAQKATEEILLAQINAETQKQLRELRAAKDQLMIQMNQETENLRLLILQNETEIKEGTTRIINAMDAEKEETLALFAQQTENLELEVLHNKTIIDQQTSAEVAEMDARTAEAINLFKQETKNLELQVLRNKTLEEELTEQQVAAIKAEQAAFRQLFRQETENLVSALQANRTQVLQETQDALVAVQTQGDLVTASTTARVDRMLAEAKAEAKTYVAAASELAAKNHAAMLADIQQHLSVGGETQLLYEWVKAFERTATTEDRATRFMDLSTPSKLRFTSNASSTV